MEKCVFKKQGKPKITKTVLNMQKFGSLACERKRKLKKNPTKAEVSFRKILDKYKIPQGFQKIIYTPNRFFIVDFKISCNGKKIIIEIDGNSHDERQEYDQKREYLISQTRWRDYRFVRIKNEQVFNGEAEEIVKNLFPQQVKKFERKELLSGKIKLKELR